MPYTMIEWLIIVTLCSGCFYIIYVVARFLCRFLSRCIERFDERETELCNMKRDLLLFRKLLITLEKDTSFEIPYIRQRVLERYTNPYRDYKSFNLDDHRGERLVKEYHKEQRLLRNRKVEEDQHVN